MAWRIVGEMTLIAARTDAAAMLIRMIVLPHPSRSLSHWPELGLSPFLPRTTAQAVARIAETISTHASNGDRTRMSILPQESRIEPVSADGVMTGMSPRRGRR
jgi:hypothetical protein